MADDEDNKIGRKTLHYWLMGIVLLALLCVAAPSMFSSLSWMYLLFPLGVVAVPGVVMILERKMKRERIRKGKRQKQKAPEQTAVTETKTRLSMKKNKKPGAVIALVPALAVFALFFFLLQWNIIIAALLSLGCYLGLSFLLTPAFTPDGVALGELKNGKEILDLLEEGERDLASIKTIADSSRDRKIQSKAREVCREGGKIVEYVTKNPHKAVMARRFFNYYLDKANEILTKYHNLVSIDIETERLASLRGKTLSALDAILQGMTAQFSRLIASDVIDIEADIKLLENAVKMEDS